MMITRGGAVQFSKTVVTLVQGLDFRTGGATLCQKLTGGMSPVPPALTEALDREGTIVHCFFSIMLEILALVAVEHSNRSAKMQEP